MNEETKAAVMKIIEDGVKYAHAQNYDVDGRRFIDSLLDIRNLISKDQ